MVWILVVEGMEWWCGGGGEQCGDEGEVVVKWW